MAVNDNERAAPYRRLCPDESPLVLNRHMLHSQTSISHIDAPFAAPSGASSEHYMRSRNMYKYASALRSLIPFRRKAGQRTELPLDDIGYFSLITFSWMTTFLKNPLPNESLTTANLDSSNVNGQRLKDFIRDENVKRGQLHASMICIVWQFLKTRIIVATFIYILNGAMYTIGLIFFLTWFLQTDEIYNLLVLVLMFSFSLILQFWSDSMTFRAANRLQSSYMSVMYKHLLRVSVLNSISAHRIVTSMAADSQKVHEGVMCLPVVLGVPFILLLPIPMLLTRMDCYTWEDSIFAVVMCLSIIPILYLLARLNTVWKSYVSIFCSKRLISLQEMLLHIPLVKMSLREKLFHRNTEDLRLKECQYLKKINFCDGFTVSLLHTVPLIVITLLWHHNGVLDMRMQTIKCKDANLISVIILLLIPYKEYLFKFWQGLIKIFDGLMAFKRLKRVLVLDCITKGTSRKPINHLIALSATEASFIVKIPNTREVCVRSQKCTCCRCVGHDSSEVEMQSKIILQHINFAAPKGRVIGICGDACAGKTALILAILGQINPQYGGDKLSRDGTYAYVGQNPWIMDATLRENILFNEMFINKRYYHVIHCCSLNDDIGQLPGGDDTLISDSMLTLGQKQRIALARALYANRDIYLLDDLLSAVSSELGTIVFERSIKKHLKDKTIIFTSRQVKFLKMCDEIFVLKNGTLVEHGNHETLMEKDIYQILINSYLQEESHKNMESEKSYDTSVGRATAFNTKGPSGQSHSVVLIPDCVEEEESVEGAVKYSSAVSFFKTLARETNSSVPLFTSLMFRITYMLAILISPILILKYLKLDSARYYIALVFFFIILTTRIFGVILYDKVTYKISLQIHRTWITSICKGCLNIIQCATHSEILRWFSIHLSEVDSYLPVNSILLVENLFLVLFLVLVLSICSLWFLIPIIALFVFCHFLLRFTNSAIMKFYVRAEEACICLNGFVSSTVIGRVTIQALGREQDYWNIFHHHCDSYLAYTQLYHAAALWLKFWICIITLSFITLLFGTLCIKNELKMWLFVFHSEEDYESIATITIFCVFLFGLILNDVTQVSVLMSSKFITLGKHDAAIKSIKPEDESSSCYLTSSPFLNGSIIFQDVKLEFWPDLQPSWRSMSFQISSGEKIGILGLPGSGKTALTAALYRLANLSQGSITIGGIDIKTVPVDHLRSSIALVPKNPLIFSGTLRMNIDPMRKYNSQELHESLEKVGMLQTVEDMPLRMDTQTHNIQEKFSVQECQLLYVAQALLRSPKILILEEPIEPLGTKDMYRVQNVVEQLFHCTVLIVAHNMRYVSKCDKIIIMKDGQVAEFDTPGNLFKNPKSCFSQMLSASTEHLLETEV